ncbi:hypothetical protein AVEN_139277-1 [Araneus ventricosus]|uniref:Uncharacterized protein n=1 Tax=Araneus ventricosus TaxID=182803 RepID=A0A4Y2D2M3_ARAVE|nr:hypothetical protein AVEN_139277-1 [Araneus ventricosus]
MRLISKTSFYSISASEGSSSQPAAPLHCFGSDVPTVLTSLQQKVESLMNGCKIGALDQVIQSLPYQATNVFFFVPCCVRSYIIVQEQNLSRRIAILAVL